MDTAATILVLREAADLCDGNDAVDIHHLIFQAACRTSQHNSGASTSAARLAWESIRLHVAPAAEAARRLSAIADRLDATSGFGPCVIDPSHTYYGGGHIAVTNFPGGEWSVKVRQSADGGWTVFAQPRNNTPHGPFRIAHGISRDEICRIGIAWASQARTLACRINAATYAGLGNATAERPLTPEQAATLGLPTAA